MEKQLSRRSCMKGIGTGAALLFSGAASQAGSQELAIDPSGIDWSNRPMYLRAYHPPYIVYYYGKRNEKWTSGQKTKWGQLIERIENEPNLTIRIIEAFDDACIGCSMLTADPNGSVWGAGFTCPSAQDKKVVKGVTLTNRRILGELGLYFGSEISMRDLVPLLEKNVPVLYEYIGGEANQEFYEKGIEDLKEKYLI